ncbi:hypothetical protein XELAEV_18020372mg [Xenopus laevis]|uniref:Anion exchange protein n=1 Tax=Xenopus laevis TaxID=8355 RepID=A0A974D768_XENLA|nr:hypothetical protein XELAEV_18020372mg [Xenopus laevis]
MYLQHRYLYHNSQHHIYIYKCSFVDDIVQRQIEDGILKPELRDKMCFVLLRKHRHQTKKPMHRSLVDTGKSVSSSTSRIQTPVHAQSRSMNDISEAPSSDQLKNKFIKKIPRDAEASNVLVGEVDFLDKPFLAFVRLVQSIMLGGVTEVPVPTRLIFILLGPMGKAKSYTEIGRAIATLMVDDIFSDVAYKAKDSEDLIAGIDEFLDEVIVLPPGEWDPTIRIGPPKKVRTYILMNKVMKMSINQCSHALTHFKKSMFSVNEAGQMNGSAGGGARSGGAASEDGEMPAAHEIGEELSFTGRFCGGLYLDIKRRLPWVPSDIYEAFHIQSISAILFIYLGCITNAITFGGLLGDATIITRYGMEHYRDGVMESFLGTAMAGSVFCLFAGQPLIILSSTGPILIFEKLLFDFSKGNDIDYMEFRLWIGLHSALQCLILVATDSSFIIQYITRFTEEGFSTLISFIFIYDAIKKMIGAFKYYPINSGFKPDQVTLYRCECVAPDPGQSTDFSEVSNTLPFLPESALSVGNSCKYVPDLALMSFILFFGTYSMTLSLKKFKFSRYFPTKVRIFMPKVLRFAIVYTILFCGVDAISELETPKFHVPSEIKYIPMPVLYGVFLYMGVASLNGIQLFMMPAKHQPDYAYLRHVPLRRVHLFILVQIICLAVLWILKSTVAAIIFPVMILGLIMVRKMLNWVFRQKKQEDKSKKKKGKEDSDSDEDKGGRSGGLHGDTSPSGSDVDRSITLHLKISCPPSAIGFSRNTINTVPQVKVEMESEYDD